MRRAVECAFLVAYTVIPPLTRKCLHVFTQVRFLTRTGVFDARAYNTNCDHTYLFRFLDYPVAYNRIDQKRSTALPACESVEESPFWNTLASGIPKFVEVSSSAADVVEWLLPAAPFESPLDFE